MQDPSTQRQVFLTIIPFKCEYVLTHKSTRTICAPYYTTLTLSMNKEPIRGGILSKNIVLRCLLLTVK